jgi:hypothetical protein
MDPAQMTLEVERGDVLDAHRGGDQDREDGEIGCLSS